jgi:1-acyl-sn-glycerol-3-phosphate acyltransferase
MSLYSFAKHFVRGVFHFVFRVRTDGIENVPTEGSVILAVNHRSVLDPVFTAITCPRQIRFMAKSELFEKKLFGGLIKKLGAFPIQRGRGDVGAIKAAFSIFKENGAMLIFPEGGRVKNGQRKDKAKPGVAMMAQRGNVPVIPVYIDGEYKWMNKITVRYGEAIRFDEYAGQKLTGDKIQELANGVLESIYALGK